MPAKGLVGRLLVFTRAIENQTIRVTIHFKGYAVSGSRVRLTGSIAFLFSIGSDNETSFVIEATTEGLSASSEGNEEEQSVAVFFEESATVTGIEFTEESGGSICMDISDEATVTMPEDITISAGTSVAGISLDKTELTLYLDTPEDESVFNVILSPSNADNKTILWASDNVLVASVDNSGLVTAVASGTETITATTADGGHQATCKITVPEGSGYTIEGQESLGIGKGLTYHIYSW